MKIQLNYKSGKSEVILCDTFEAVRDALGFQIEFGGAYPKPIWLNLPDIESIWDLT